MEIYHSPSNPRHKDFGHYFGKAIANVAGDQLKTYQTLEEIENPREGILIVNWPEEIISWSVDMKRAEIALNNLTRLKRCGLKIIYVWHNTIAHHQNKGKEKLYEYFQSNADLILHLNTWSLSIAERQKPSIISKFVHHPFMRNPFPKVEGDSLLVYGRIRTRTQLSQLLLATWVCSLISRQIYLGSFPARKAPGRFTKVIYRLIPKNDKVIINEGKLEGELERTFWKNSKTVLALRGKRNTNSGILIQGIAEHRNILIGNVRSARDYNHLKCLSIFKNLISFVHLIVHDSKTPYDLGNFSTADFKELTKNSSLEKFEEALHEAIVLLRRGQNNSLT